MFNRSEGALVCLDSCVRDRNSKAAGTSGLKSDSGQLRVDKAAVWLIRSLCFVHRPVAEAASWSEMAALSLTITFAFRGKRGRGTKKRCHSPPPHHTHTQIHTLKAADLSPAVSLWSPAAVLRAGKCIIISKEMAV